MQMHPFEKEELQLKTELEIKMSAFPLFTLNLLL